MPSTAILGNSVPDLTHILKEMAEEICDQSIRNPLSSDTDVQNFMMLLCQRIDARNILTHAELSE
jgi:hypothetical protein